MVTKSGTNQPHGALFNFFRDDALNQRGWFENPANKKNPLRQNQFGFQMDGPVFIPKLYDGHNRTFFMGAYEGVRAESLSSPFASVPTALMRQGNFSEISAAVRNPFTGQPFTGNIIPSSMISPVALNLLDYYPAANLTGTSNNVQALGSNRDNVDQFLGRVDQNVGNKIRLSVRYNWHDSVNTNIGAIPITGITQPRVNKNTLVSYTHTLKPNLLNDFRIGYHRIDFDTLNEFAVNNKTGVGAGLDIPAFSPATSRTTTGIPSVNISNFSGLGTVARTGTSSTRRFRCPTRWPSTVARTIFEPGSTCGAWPPAGARPTTLGACSRSPETSPATRSPIPVGLPRTVITPTDQLQGHVRLAQRVLHR